MTDTNSIVTLPVLNKRMLLLRSPYFADLSTEYLERIEELIVEEHFERDDIIFSEGDGNRYLYLVASGAAKIFGTSADGKEQILDLARPGDSFNDVAAFDGGVNPTGAQALTPLVVYRLSGQVLLDRSCHYGALAANIVRGLANRVRELGDLVADLSFRPVAGRLAKILLEQLPHAGATKLTQKDMAAMAGTAREVVARALKSLEEEGIIRTERQRIVILDRTALENLAA